MSESKRINGTLRPVAAGYEWRYEYYEYEEPVSFEGLAAHQYSVVIVFWVGLAVFVIFLFFVLTLLAKTGVAPPPEDAFGKRRAHLAAGRMEQLHLHTLQHNVAFTSDPLLCAATASSSRSLLHRQVHEEEMGKPAANRDLGVGPMAARDGPPGPAAAPETRVLLARETAEDFGIPNVVHFVKV
ncbi:unnamed protein product [Merluccius merluccius]